MRKQATLLPTLFLAPAAIVFAQADAAPAQQITVTSAGSQKVIVGPPDHFTGQARVRSLFDAKAPSHETGGVVAFQPGARSVWHTHPLGQVLIVTEGEGWVQEWGGAVQVMHKGEVVYIPAGVKHWHGASPTSSVTHVALQEEQNGVNVVWLEPVTDEQYNPKQK